MTLLIILLTALLSVTFTPHAAILEVNYTGVTVQRAGTEAWLPLQPLSIAPIGDGDNIQTNNVGRATLHFDGILSVFIMPNVQATLNNFTLSDTGQADVSLTTTGLSIINIQQPELLNNFTLTIGNITIIQPATSFSVWLSTNNQISITVQQGDLVFEQDGQRFEVLEKHGYNQLRDHITPIDFFPLNEATVLTSIIRCEGLATADDNQNLTVRSSPTPSGQVIGYIQDRTPTHIIGISSDERRLRVRYYSSFGWVEAKGVTYQCDNLPTYDLSQQEAYYTIVNPSPSEYVLTYPYFGSVTDDPYFYIYQNAPSGE